MNGIFKSKYALITGASTGIGKAIAIEFAKQGAFVFITARTEDKLKVVQQVIEKNAGNAKAVPADLSNIESINDLIEMIKKDTNSFESFSQGVIINTFNVGITAPTLLVHGLLPLMPVKSKRLNISGKFSHGAKNWLPYYLSKKAIEDLTMGLSEELAKRSVQVNCISPSDTGTESYKEFYPRVEELTLTPEEVAQYACYLCSEEANNITGKVYVMIAGCEPYEAFHT